ncbi:HEAT repeat domain-containing protein [Tolypothrix bouteillei VB521301]|nr:HEAT repeat domain-containing protein [Tolypothrix bouteillei VB521301]
MLTQLTIKGCAIAVVCLAVSLLEINTIWAQSQNDIQIKSYIEQLKNPQQRSAAIENLVTAGKSAIPALITALQDSNPQVRASAAAILGQMGPNASEAAPAILRVIDDGDPVVRSSAVLAIQKIGKQAYVPHLIAGLNSTKSWERYNASHGLRAMGKDAAPAVPVLMRKLQDEGDPWMRVSAASTLGSIGTASTPAIPILVMRLQDTDITARHSAAYALGTISSKWQQNIKQLPTQELDKIISNLEKALKVVQDPALQFRPEAVTSVSEPLAALRKERLNREKR